MSYHSALDLELREAGVHPDQLQEPGPEDGEDFPVVVPMGARLYCDRCLDPVRAAGLCGDCLLLT